MMPGRLSTPSTDPGDQTQPPCPRRDEAWFLQRGLTAQHLDSLVAKHNSNRYFSENMALDILKNPLDCYSIRLALPLASLVDIKSLFASYLQHPRHEFCQTVQKTTLRLYRDMWQLVPPELAPYINNFLRCDNHFPVEHDRFVAY